MRLNRPLLYTGAFVVAVGGVAVAADLAAIDVATMADLVRLWPLALVAGGVALGLRRTRSLANSCLGSVITYTPGPWSATASTGPGARDDR